MTLESVAVPESSAAPGFCSCCGAKIKPYFSDNAVASQNQINQLISENFLTVKGAALFLPRGNGSSPSPAPRITQRRNKHAGDLQQHLQTMFTLLRPEDTIRLAVRLESAYPLCTRYMVIVSTNGRQDTEESVVLGMDFSSSDHSCTVGLVLPLWSDTLIHLDGDGGFSVSTVNRVHVFKPVSVQAMWSALQSLHKVCEVARCHNYYPGSLFLTWVSYYQSRVSSNQHCINEWNAMQDVQSHRADSPVLFTDPPTERERTERLIKTRLREIMMQKDLENVTSKEIRTELEMQMVCNLREFKEFIDNEMIVILGQMDSPTEIFDHVFLGSEWNASNLEELQNSGVRYILNVTREIDNFFPGLFEYHNIRVYDEEATNLLEYWNETYKFITKAKKAGAKCLVHCKMGVSRSASTVIAYAMKEYGWDLERAFDHVKERRTVTKPNPSFMKQLEEYQGILLASKQRHNKLWRSHSDSELSETHGPICKAPRSLERSDPHSNGSPSIQEMLDLNAVLESLTKPQLRQLKSYPPSISGEDPILLPLPRQRSSTVVPEKKSKNHHSLQDSIQDIHVASSCDSSSDPSLQSSHRVPEPNSVQLFRDVPVHNGPYNASDAAVSQSIQLCLVSLDHEKTPQASLTTSDANSLQPVVVHDLEAEGEGVVTSSTDRIDFNSAREKFRCLSQERQPQSGSEGSAVRPPPSASSPPVETSSDGVDECLAQSEISIDLNSPSQPLPHDTVSVRHLVTELESISHSSSPTPPRTSEETSEEAPSSGHSGSVRRATEQLELTLRQGQELVASHTPSPDHPLTSFSPPEGSHANHTGDEAKLLDDEDSGIIPDPSFSVFLESSVSVEADQLTLNPTFEASSGSSSLLWLEGVTELESDVDDLLRPQCRMARSSEDLLKIQETLRELQAFLYEAGGLGQAEQKLSTRDQPEPAERGSELKAPVWQRAMEIEARIRQAGLTPPSLMKRSASLAKLDRLELSTNDLNDWDFHPAPSIRYPPPSCSRSPPPAHNHDDAHKKQRVLPQSPCPPDLHLMEPGRTEGLLSPSPDHATGSCSGRQQAHGKSLPVRRFRKATDKKKTVTVLYNTM